MPLTPGTKLGHFEILSAIGEGGMGEVYRAPTTTSSGGDVAIKVIRADAIESSDRRERFVREAKAAAVLNHPNIATVYEIDEADGLTFIAMELIEGVKLSDLIASGNLSTERAIEIAIDVAEGLSAAHAKNIVHRDLKPGNIMILEDGRPKIIDFGLAKLLETGSEAETATKGQAMMGTVAYMSPEQARSGEIDHRSDVFSFDVVLYEMLVGEKTFRGAKRTGDIERDHQRVGAPPTVDARIFPTDSGSLPGEGRRSPLLECARDHSRASRDSAARVVSSQQSARGARGTRSCDRVRCFFQS